MIVTDVRGIQRIIDDSDFYNVEENGTGSRIKFKKSGKFLNVINTLDDIRNSTTTTCIKVTTYPRNKPILIFYRDPFSIVRNPSGSWTDIKNDDSPARSFRVNESLIDINNQLITQSPIGPIVVANTVFVSEDGDDATAERENPLKPFRYPWSAVAAANTGDRVVVLAGIYELNDGTAGSDLDDGTKTLIKNGVNIYLPYGATIFHSKTGPGFSELLSDGGVSAQVVISGGGTLRFARGLADTTLMQAMSNTTSELSIIDCEIYAGVGFLITGFSKFHFKPRYYEVAEGLPCRIDPLVNLTQVDLIYAPVRHRKTSSLVFSKNWGLIEVFNIIGGQSRVEIHFPFVEYDTDAIFSNSMIKIDDCNTESPLLKVRVDRAIDLNAAAPGVNRAYFLNATTIRANIDFRLYNITHNGRIYNINSPSCSGIIEIKAGRYYDASSSQIQALGRLIMDKDIYTNGTFNASGSGSGILIKGRIRTDATNFVFFKSTGTALYASIQDLLIYAPNLVGVYAFDGSTAIISNIQVIGDCISNAGLGFANPLAYNQLVDTGSNNAALTF